MEGVLVKATSTDTLNFRFLPCIYIGPASLIQQLSLYAVSERDYKGICVIEALIDYGWTDSSGSTSLVFVTQLGQHHVAFVILSEWDSIARDRNR